MDHSRARLPGITPSDVDAPSSPNTAAGLLRIRTGFLVRPVITTDAAKDIQLRCDYSMPAPGRQAEKTQESHL